MGGVLLSSAPLFQTVLMGGFECAAQRLGNGVRLDLAASTGHDVRAAEDYGLLRSYGLRGARDGLRWHLIERSPGQYDWSSFLPSLRAARHAGVSVAWDLLHYGAPEGVDLFSARFIDRFAAFARAAARVIANETDHPPTFTPINEISFWAWAGGDNGGLNPFSLGQGSGLKRQLVRASLAAGDAVRAVDRRARIACAEPLIHIFPSDSTEPAKTGAAEYNAAQFEALDLLLGRAEPELGGREDAVDIVGVNYYYNNQWIDEVRPVFLGDWQYRPLHELLIAVASRYRKPVYIAETGTEGVFRPYWLRYVCDEVREAARSGGPVQGICLYPILSHLGWDDDRPCQNGLFDGHSPQSDRRAFEPLAREVREQGARFAAAPPLTLAPTVSPADRAGAAS